MRGGENGRGRDSLIHHWKLAIYFASIFNDTWMLRVVSWAPVDVKLEDVQNTTKLQELCCWCDLIKMVNRQALAQHTPVWFLVTEERNHCRTL